MRLPIIKKVINYTIPLYGNKRLFLYATLLVSDGKNKKIIKTKEEGGKTYFTFNRKRYGIRNNGNLYFPCLQVTEY